MWSASRPYLYDVMKFSYLKSKLKDKARLAIEGFTLTNENVDYVTVVNGWQLQYAKKKKLQNNLTKVPNSIARGVRNSKPFIVSS